MSKSTQQINKQLSFITRAGAKLDAFIQETGLDVLAHYIEHMDVRMVNRLYQAMPKGARHVAMAEWIMLHFAVKANTGADKAEMPFVVDKDRVNDDVGAKAKNWFDCKKSPAVDQVYDVRKAVMAILNKAKGSKAVLVGSDDALLKMAEAVGIPASDVPMGLKIAACIEDARKLLTDADE